MFYQEYDFLNDGSDEDVGIEGGNESSDDDDLKRVLRHIGGVQEDEDFETTMENELNAVVMGLEADRMSSGQTGISCANSSGSQKSFRNEEPEGPSTSKPSKKTDKKPKKVAFESTEPKFYNDEYFDSDDEEESTGGENQKKKHPVIDNEELFYDPNMDDKDQSWLDKKRREYQPRTASADSFPSNSPKKRKVRERGLPTSDAILDCPACMTTLCLDCQRHEVYHQQYRAMFVKNCRVDTSQSLKYKTKKQFHKKRQTTAQDAAAAAGMDDEDVYFPVKCTECGTEVAVYDKDQVYHFFNVLASHA